MRIHTFPRSAVLIVGVLLAGCQSLTGRSHGLRGGIDIKNEKLASSSTVTGPRTVYVADFQLDAGNVKTDSGIGGVADEVTASNGILGRISQRLSRSSISGDAQQQTPEIVSAMANDLIESFRKQGIPAQRIDAASSDLPADGWLLQGKFTDVDEGNRMQRAAVGFGLGATQMAIDLSVSDLASANPRQPFITFATTKEASMKPGGFNPYAIAAKFHMEKNATDKDIQGTADQIVEEILKYKTQFAAQARTTSQATIPQ